MIRRIDGLLATLVLVALAIGVAWLREPERLAGGVRVIDGDTVELDGRRLRLAGLDAPELHQTCERDSQVYPCGVAARDALRRLVQGAELHCRLNGVDRYRRDLAACSGPGGDLGATMVRDGMAVGYGGYMAEEREAQEGRAGLWAGRFERPSAWREAHRTR